MVVALGGVRAAQAKVGWSCARLGSCCAQGLRLLFYNYVSMYGANLDSRASRLR